MKLFNPIAAYSRWSAQAAADDETIALQQEIFNSGAIPVIDYPNTSLSLD